MWNSCYSNKNDIMNNCTKSAFWVQIVVWHSGPNGPRSEFFRERKFPYSIVPAKLFVPLLYPGYLSVVKGSEFSKTMALNFSMGRVFRLVLSPKRCLGFNTSAFRRKAACKNETLILLLQNLQDNFRTWVKANKDTKRANLNMILPSKSSLKWNG